MVLLEMKSGIVVILLKLSQMLTVISQLILHAKLITESLISVTYHHHEGQGSPPYHTTGWKLQIPSETAGPLLHSAILQLSSCFGAWNARHVVCFPGDQTGASSPAHPPPCTADITGNHQPVPFCWRTCHRGPWPMVWELYIMDHTLKKGIHSTPLANYTHNPR